MSRGRGGYSSQRGSSYRGSSRGSGGYMSRGSNSSGRFSSFSNNSFDNRNRYSGNSGADHRFSGTRNHDDYRKSYRSDRDSNYRDNHHRSPDRKRMRHDASSSRHDNYGGSSSSNYNSSSRYDSSNNFSSSSRRSFSSDRHSGGGGPRSRGSNDFRKPAPPPPPAPAPPSRRRVSGGFRNGDNSSRMSSRAGGPRSLRMGRDRPLPRRRLQGRSYAIRKRAMATRSVEYARKLKITRMRRVIAARRQRRRFDENSPSPTPSSTKNKGDNSTDKKTADKSTDGDVKSEKGGENSGESSGNPAVKKVEKESDKKGEVKSEKENSPKRDQPKLICPHCNTSTYKYYAYEMHLSSRLHLAKMRRVALKQKSVLSQMRLAQRNAQNELEKDNDDLAARTNFCPLCKLNYKQRKEVHQQSDAHKNMKKFLMPYCKICHLTCKSPMMYENHCCSIKHLKRKYRVENGTNSEGSAEEDSLENFTTIDSVGDEVEEESKDGENKESVMNLGIEKIKKVEAYYCELCKMYLSRHCTGAEADELIARHCKNRIHMRNLVRHQEDLDIEKRLKKLQRKEAAEKESKNKETQETNESSVTVDQDISMRSLPEGDVNKVPTEEGNKKIEVIEIEDDPVNVRDEKLWEDMDKDIGDILAEAESGNKTSDEDEEDESHINGERYDRFRQSEKNGEEISENTPVNSEEKKTTDVVTAKEEKGK